MILLRFYELTANGIVIKKDKLNNYWLGPDDQKEIEIPFTLPEIKSNTEYHVKVLSILSKDMPWAEKGLIIAWDQFKIPIENPKMEHEDIQKIPDIILVDLKKVQKFYEI